MVNHDNSKVYLVQQLVCCNQYKKKSFLKMGYYCKKNLKYMGLALWPGSG